MATGIIEFPIFTGDGLRTWISWLEEFFVREDFTDDEKLNLAQSVMEGEAISWFQWRQSLWLFNSWEALKKSLWLRFGSDEDPENIKYNKEIQKGLEQLRSFRPWSELKSKGVSKSSDSHPQVIKPLETDDLEIESLGYRRNSQVCDNEESLVKKTELPVFDGFMPYGWICRVERVFRAGQYNEEAKLDLVYTSLEGAGLDWFTAEVTNREFRDWSNFKKKFLAHFEPKTCGSQSAVSIQVPKSVQIIVLQCETTSVTTLKKTESLEKHESHSNFCVPKSQQAESTKSVQLQAVSEPCSQTSLESDFDLKRHVVPFEVSSADVLVHNSEESYVLPIQESDECTQYSTRGKSTNFVSKGFKKRLMRDNKIQHMRKRRMSLKSWRFKYKSIQVMKVSALNHQRHVSHKEAANTDSTEVQRWDYAIWMHSEHDQIQIMKCYKTWHFKYKDERKNSLKVGKYNVMGSIRQESSDSFVRITNKDCPGVNKKMYGSLREIENGASQPKVVTVLFEGQKEQHNKDQGKFSVAGLFKLIQRKRINAKLDSVPLTLLLMHPSRVEQRDIFGVWHCWKTWKLRQVRWLALQFSPAIKTQQQFRHGFVTYIFRRGSMTIVNAKPLTSSASWYARRKHFSIVRHQWRTYTVAFDGESDQYRASVKRMWQLHLSSLWCQPKHKYRSKLLQYAFDSVLLMVTEVKLDRNKNECWLNEASILQVENCRLLKYIHAQMQNAEQGMHAHSALLMHITSHMIQIQNQVQHKYKQRKCLKNWMFKYKTMRRYELRLLPNVQWRIKRLLACGFLRPHFLQPKLGGKLVKRRGVLISLIQFTAELAA